MVLQRNRPYILNLVFSIRLQRPPSTSGVIPLQLGSSLRLLVFTLELQLTRGPPPEQECQDLASQVGTVL